MKYSIYLLLAVLVASLHACTYTQKVKDGDTAFERKQYALAIPMLEKDFRRAKETKEKGRIAFMIGESYDKVNQGDKALEWYEAAVKNRYGIPALKKYAYALKRAEMYEDAREAFDELGNEEGNVFAYRKEMQACRAAIQWKKEAGDNLYNIETASFNSAVADYSPTLYKDGSIVISSDRPNESEIYQWTGSNFSDLLIINLETGSVEKFGENINSAYNEGTATFNKDFNSIIFSRCGTGGDTDDYCKLMRAERKGDGWSKPKVLPFVLDKVNYSHPTWSPDGKTLYFVSDEDDGWGGFDIYSVQPNTSGWNEPRLLSARINTELDDMFPSFHDDTLYFASEGHGGMGGLDIYRTHKGENGKWIKAENLRAPMNTGEDDFGLIVMSNEKDGDISQTGYFSSSRKGGMGGDDIYSFRKKTPPPVIIIPEPDTPKVVVPEPDIFLDIYVYGKVYSNPNDPKSTVTGRTPLAGARLQINADEGRTNAKTDEKGMHSIQISKESDYRIFASSPDYLNKAVNFSTLNQGEQERYRVDILLDKIFRNVEINLDNIYYDYNKWDIREDAKPTLNKLANLLNKNPNINIILGSHTDCRGRENYNQELSQKRAQSAVDYLVTLGVSSQRMKAIGYGESSPAADCACSSCSEDEHQENRRTTFRIVD